MKNLNADKGKIITKEPKKYNEKLKVKGSFLDIIKASVKDAKIKENKKP